MPRRRDSGRRRKRRGLTRRQRANLTIGRNCGGIGPERPFETEEERRQAWEDHKEELLATCRAGRRPQAFWDYGPHERLPHETHLQALWRLDLLTADELEYLQALGRIPPPAYSGEDPRAMLG